MIGSIPRLNHSMCTVGFRVRTRGRVFESASMLPKEQRASFHFLDRLRVPMRSTSPLNSNLVALQSSLPLALLRIEDKSLGLRQVSVSRNWTHTSV